MKRSVVFQAKPTVEQIEQMLGVYGISLTSKNFTSEVFQKKEQEGVAMFHKIASVYHRSSFQKRLDFFKSYVLVISILRELVRKIGYTIECKTTNHRAGVRHYTILKLPDPIEADVFPDAKDFKMVFD